MFKSWPWDDLDQSYGNGLNIYDSKNKYTPGAGLLPPRGNIHVYYHNIQRSSLIPLGHSKSSFVWSILRKGE